MCVFTCARARTGLAWFVPGFAHIVGTAAQSLCGVEVELLCTGTATVVPVTQTFPHV